LLVWRRPAPGLSCPRPFPCTDFLSNSTRSDACFAVCHNRIRLTEGAEPAPLDPWWRCLLFWSLRADASGSSTPAAHPRCPAGRGAAIPVGAGTLDQTTPDPQTVIRRFWRLPCSTAPWWGWKQRCDPAAGHPCAYALQAGAAACSGSCGWALLVAAAFPSVPAVPGALLQLARQVRPGPTTWLAALSALCRAFASPACCCCEAALPICPASFEDEGALLEEALASGSVCAGFLCPCSARRLASTAVLVFLSAGYEFRSPHLAEPLELPPWRPPGPVHRGSRCSRFPRRLRCCPQLLGSVAIAAATAGLSPAPIVGGLTQGAIQGLTCLSAASAD